MIGRGWKIRSLISKVINQGIRFTLLTLLNLRPPTLSSLYSSILRTSPEYNQPNPFESRSIPSLKGNDVFPLKYCKHWQISIWTLQWWVFDGCQWRIQDFLEVGVPTHQGRQHTILPNFPKSCMQLKEFGPWGGAMDAYPPSIHQWVSRDDWDPGFGFNGRVKCGLDIIRLSHNVERVWIGWSSAYLDMIGSGLPTLSKDR